MNKLIILFFKGMIIGIGKIIPGVSGSFLAMTLGVYEEAINRLRLFKDNWKENSFYFLPLGLGIVLAIILGSKLIMFFYEKYYLFTMLFFIGLLLGTIPSFVRVHRVKSKDILFIVMLFLLLVFVFDFISFPTFVMKKNITDYIFIFFLGLIEVFTTLIPGISSTATYIMLGSYEFILNLFSSPFSDILSLIMFFLGFLLGFVFLIKFLSYLLEKKSAFLWIVIYAFLIYALFFLVKGVLLLMLSKFFPCIILAFLGYQIGSSFSLE